MLVTAVIPVYHDGIRAVSAATAMLQQQLSDGDSLEVVIVDDGSGDDTSALVSSLRDPGIRSLILPENRGRSAARNAGAAVAAGSVLVFMDCDCLPTAGRFIASHVDALRDAVAVTGRVVGSGAGFWDRYQRDASVRREQQHAKGIFYAGSSQNLAIQTATFNAIGGFDTRYRNYGFEDRDLLLRAARLGRIAWNADAEVRHMDALTLQAVSAKMRDAGRSTSVVFAEDHPEAYQALGFAAIDARAHPWMRWMALAAGGMQPALARAIDRICALNHLPYPLAKPVAKIVGAMGYLAGTADSRV